MYVYYIKPNNDDNRKVQPRKGKKGQLHVTSDIHWKFGMHELNAWEKGKFGYSLLVGRHDKF